MKRPDILPATFEPEIEFMNIVRWTNAWFEKNGPKATAVIGISGGKDSTIAAALLTEALGKERVLGVLMPNGVQQDIEDAREVVKILDIPNIEINIGFLAELLETQVKCAFELMEKAPKAMHINIPPRLRMTILYAVAQFLPNGGRVANTCNRSEDYIGYSTKYGDAAGDFAMLSDYTVTELIEIGKVAEKISGLPARLIEKAPADGLCGRTDEDAIGFSYYDLDRFLLGQGEPDKEIMDRIKVRHTANMHKNTPMDAYVRPF